MKQVYLIALSLFLVSAVQAQKTPVMPTVQGLMQKLHDVRNHTGAQLREEVSCTRDVDFTWNGTSMKWDSTSMTETTIDDVNGKFDIAVNTFDYDAADGFVLMEKILGFGIEGDINNPDMDLTSFDSLLLYGPDPLTSQLILIARILPTYDGNGNLVKQETHFNTAFFGIPLGFVLFGVNLYYYDGNNFLIAEASKQVDLGTFSLENGDSTTYTNNVAGQVLMETTFEWDPDLLTYNNVSQTTNTYVSVGGDVASTVYQSWDDNTMAWIYNSQSLFTYLKAGVVSKETIQTGSPGNWTTVQEIAYTYDGMDRITQILYQDVAGNGTKTNSGRETISWDTPEGWISNSVYQTYVAGTWVNSSRTISEPCEPVSALDPVQGIQDLKAWFDANGQLNLTWDETANARRLEVYDLQGRVAMGADLRSGQTRFDASRLMPGVYLVRVTFADGGTAARQAQKY